MGRPIQSAIAAFSGRSAVFVGLFAAGLAFAMQEMVGAVAGWVNSLTGHVYRVGDRIELFNYSAAFDFVWEELTLPHYVSQRSTAIPIRKVRIP